MGGLKNSHTKRTERNRTQFFTKKTTLAWSFLWLEVITASLRWGSTARWA
jgi:hypothetical protein